jgi:hypothetical protein
MKTFKTYIKERTDEAVDLVVFMDRVDVDGVGVAYEDFMEHINQKYKASKIGEGSFAAVSVGGNGKDYVVKTWSKDPAYESYLSICRAKAGLNSLYPKVLAYKVLNGLNGPRKVAIIEHLEIDEGRAGRRRLDAKVSVSVHVHFSLIDSLYALSKGLELGNWQKRVLNVRRLDIDFINLDDVPNFSFSEIIQKLESTEMLMNLNVDIKELQAWLDDYHQYGPDLGYSLDLHSGNVGWRANSECVFFDPIWKPQ